MSLHTAIHAIAIANPTELFEIWCRVDSFEQDGSFGERTAEEWKAAIFRTMVELGLKPEDVAPAPVEDPSLSLIPC